jgi:nicotinate phosphoribosyltransferase
MRAGRRLRPSRTLAEIRARAARELERLPEPLRKLDAAAPYPVKLADALTRLTKEIDRRA